MTFSPINVSLLFILYLGPTETCRILVPRLEVEPGAPAVEAQSPKHWTTREDPLHPIMYFTIFCGERGLQEK